MWGGDGRGRDIGSKCSVLLSREAGPNINILVCQLYLEGILVPQLQATIKLHLDQTSYSIDTSRYGHESARKEAVIAMVLSSF